MSLEETKTLLFTPTKRGFFKKSPFYSLAMFGRSLIPAFQFLTRASVGHGDVLLADEYIERFWKIHFQESATKLYVSGREYLDPKRTYVYMSNHASWMDIPAMFGAVPSSLRMISKAGLMAMPLLGPAMEKAGFIAIDRKNRSRAIRQLEHAKARLKSGISIWIAPEGTRSRDKNIAPFKKGGFHVARQLGMPIVPVYIEGAREVMQADSMMVYSNKSITVHFCKPVETANYDKKHTDMLIDQVRNEIITKQKECEENS